MVLLGKGAPPSRSYSVMGLDEKSPRRSAAVRVCARVSPAAVRIHRFWKPPNANSLSFLIGPPRVKPAWLRFNWSCCREKKLLAFSSVLRTNQKPFPWMLFVPDLVTTLTAPAELLPESNPLLLVSTENSWTASGNGNGRL